MKLIRKLHGSLLFLLVVAFILPAIVSCKSIEPITKQVAWDVEYDGGTIDGFRFLISTDVKLERLERSFATTERQTTVSERTIRTQINLSKKTLGRMQSGNIDDVLNVSFEPRNGTYPTLAFIQNKGTGPNDKFYFNWNTDPASGKRYIEYEGGEYTVSYKGNEEPYLLYQKTAKEKTKSRKMGGVR